MQNRNLFFTLAFTLFVIALSALAKDKKQEIPFFQSPPHESSKTLSEILLSPEMKSKENIVIGSLYSSESVSHHISRIRDRETLHTHDAHDMTVVMMSGKGNFVIGEHTIKMEHGNVAYVPRKLKHKFINTGKEPAVALVIFTPAFDGKDRVSVDEK